MCPGSWGSSHVGYWVHWDGCVISVLTNMGWKIQRTELPKWGIWMRTLMAEWEVGHSIWEEATEFCLVQSQDTLGALSRLGDYLLYDLKQVLVLFWVSDDSVGSVPPGVSDHIHIGFRASNAVSPSQETVGELAQMGWGVWGRTLVSGEWGFWEAWSSPSPPWFWCLPPCPLPKTSDSNNNILPKAPNRLWFSEGENKIVLL